MTTAGACLKLLRRCRRSLVPHSEGSSLVLETLAREQRKGEEGERRARGEDDGISGLRRATAGAAGGETDARQQQQQPAAPHIAAAARSHGGRGHQPHRCRCECRPQPQHRARRHALRLDDQGALCRMVLCEEGGGEGSPLGSSYGIAPRPKGRREGTTSHSSGGSGGGGGGAGSDGDSANVRCIINNNQWDGQLYAMGSPADDKSPGSPTDTSMFYLAPAPALARQGKHLGFYLPRLRTLRL